MKSRKEINQYLLDELGLMIDDYISIGDNENYYKIAGDMNGSVYAVGLDGNVRQYALINLFDVDFKLSQRFYLTDKEKEYLSSVLEPFLVEGNDIIITKRYANAGCVMEYLLIKGDDLNFSFPCFRTGTRYKKLSVNVEYSPKELGL